MRGTEVTMGLSPPRAVTLQGILAELGWTRKGSGLAKGNLLMWERETSPRAVRKDFCKNKTKLDLFRKGWKMSQDLTVFTAGHFSAP